MRKKVGSAAPQKVPFFPPPPFPAEGHENQNLVGRRDQIYKNGKKVSLPLPFFSFLFLEMENAAATGYIEDKV